MTLIRIIFRIFLVLSMCVYGTSASAEIVVVANKSTRMHGISLIEVRDLYMGKHKSFSNGQRAAVADQKTGSDIHKQFYRKVLNLTENELSRYWAKRKFTRKFTPPRVIVGDMAMKQWIAITPGSLGYIDSKSLDGSVKVLLIIP